MKYLILLVFAMALTLPASAAQLDRQQRWEITTAAHTLEEAVGHFYRHFQGATSWRLTENIRKYLIETDGFHEMVQDGRSPNYEVLQDYEELVEEYYRLRRDAHSLADREYHLLHDWDVIVAAHIALIRTMTGVRADPRQARQPRLSAEDRCYLQRYSDICKNSPDEFCNNPSSHYNKFGRYEGRVWGCVKADPRQARQPRLSAEDRCYLQRYPDICKNSPDEFCKSPSNHYDKFGKFESRIWGCD
jgi:hypothetical protein